MEKIGQKFHTETRKGANGGRKEFRAKNREKNTSGKAGTERAENQKMRKERKRCKLASRKMHGGSVAREA